MGKQLAMGWLPSITQLDMTQTTLRSRIESMRAESRRWHEEHRRWKKDIVGWLKIQRRIEALLYQLERELPDYREVATHLSDVIEDHEIRLQEHDRLLNRYLEQGREDAKEWRKLEEAHEKQARLHTEVQEEHEAFRSAYVGAMKRVERLVKRLQALCSGSR